MTFFGEQLIFILSIVLVLFTPGYFLLRAVYGRRILSSIERFVLSFGMSFIVVDLLMIILGKGGISLTRGTIGGTVLLFSIFCYLIYRYRFGKEKNNDEEQELFSFSKNQLIVILSVLSLTVFLKTVYLTNTIFPTATDLGHHMYWTQRIVETGLLPVYQETEITQEGSSYTLSAPRPIADFIIGEHLPFAAISLLSGASTISAFPSLVLFLINMIGNLAVFVLAARFFEKMKETSFAQNTAILTLFVLGPLYAISGAQAKFVSGGVIGNLIGNLFLPMALYFFYRALAEKNEWHLSFGILSVIGLIYTHHLSTFVFLYIFVFSIILFIVLHIKNIQSYAIHWWKILWTPQVMVVIIGCLLFVSMYTPNYLTSEAIESATGGPSKETRAGVTFSQLTEASGEVRMAIGLVGLVLLFFIKKVRQSYIGALLGGWALAILLMSLVPQWLYLDIPSNRIANYSGYPLAILSGFALVWIFTITRSSGKTFLPYPILVASCVLLITFAFVSGMSDNVQLFKTLPNTQSALQTFHAAKYLSQRTANEDIVLKDHNYIVADAWIKLFFLRDYNNPLSRGLFHRYESNREHCTLTMISTPNTEEGQKCFDALGVTIVMVHPQFDSEQFGKSEQFSKVYAGSDVAIFVRKK